MNEKKLEICSIKCKKRKMILYFSGFPLFLVCKQNEWRRMDFVFSLLGGVNYDCFACRNPLRARFNLSEQEQVNKPVEYVICIRSIFLLSYLGILFIVYFCFFHYGCETFFIFY